MQIARRLISAEFAFGAAAVGAAIACGFVLVRLGDLDDQVKAGLLVVGLLAVGVALIRPRFALALVLVAAPFQFEVRAGPLVTGTNELLVLAMALLLLPRIRTALVPRWYAMGGGAIVLGSLVSALIAVDPAQAVWGATRWLGVLLLGAAAFSLLNRTSDLRWFINILSGTVVVVAAFAVLQRAGVYVLVGPAYLPDRIDSTFGYYTQFATFMAFAAILCFAALGDREIRSHGALFGAFAGVLGVAISLSRGGLAVLVSGFVVFFLLRMGRRGSGRLALAMLAVVALAWVAAPADLWTAFAERFAAPLGTTNSDRTRFALQEAGLDALVERPLGLGYANFPEYVSSRVGSGSIDQVFFHAHQTFVQVGLDGGWLALVGLVVLLGGALLVSLRRAIGPQVPATVAAAGAALVGLSVQGAFEYLFAELSFLVFLVTLVWVASTDFLSTETGAPRAEQG